MLFYLLFLVIGGRFGGGDWGVKDNTWDFVWVVGSGGKEDLGRCRFEGEEDVFGIGGCVFVFLGDFGIDV